jgi:hypothetical protein
MEFTILSDYLFLIKRKFFESLLTFSFIITFSLTQILAKNLIIEHNEQSPLDRVLRIEVRLVFLRLG